MIKWLQSVSGTQPGRNRKLLFTLVMCLGVGYIQAQNYNCTSATPTFTVDLTGNPSGTWTSPPQMRGGSCCSTDNNCVQFVVTLDPQAEGILFSIPGGCGASPSGSLFYQVDCGPLTTVGTALCLNGTGPHVITFCKPGGNANCYSITSFPQPSASPDLVTNDGCSATMSVSGLNAGSITWTSVGPGAVGQYNNYLACTSGCATNTVTPQPGYPTYIDYRVCGTVIGACSGGTFCDTIRVNIYPTLGAYITPVNPTVCFGAAGTTITANGSGGLAPYSYQWSTGATTQSIFVGPGTYSVNVTDATGCPFGSTSVTVTQFSNTITANAGNDLVACGQTPSVTLSGSVTGVSTGAWSGGAGIFSPSATALNATYTPTAAEVAQGFADLVLTTTNNGTCPLDRDTVHITFTSFLSSLNPQVTNVACFGESTGAINLSPTGGHLPLTYAWSTGAVTEDITGLAAGTYTVTATDAMGCTATESYALTQPSAAIVTVVQSVDVTCNGGSNGLVNLEVVGGVPPYSYVWSNGATTQDLSDLTAGTYTVAITDLAGCTNATATVTVNEPPLYPSLAGTVQNVSCFGGNNGAVSVTASGGTAPYTYEWSTGDTTSSVNGLVAGDYSVTVYDGSCAPYGVELVNNSGFESGNTGFSSSYSYCNTNGCLVPEGRYAIGENPTTFHSNFFGTPNAGTNFMIVNGIGQPNTAVWCQSITVEPNTNYNFSTWVTSVNPTAPALLQFSINGNTIGNIFQAPASTGVWLQFFATWNSGSNTSAQICVVNQNTVASGNDFGLDNISFMECITCSSTETFTVTEPPQLQVQVTAFTDVTCNGAANGTATVSVTGGVAPYTVSWSGGQTGTSVSGLTPGTHTITVQDANGCTATTTVTITQPLPLAGVAASTGNYNGQPVSCNGSSDGTISATPSGGTAPYTYAWSNGATTQTVTGVGAGTYTVTITDANGCTATSSVTLIEPPVLTGTASVTSNYNGQGVSCNGSTDGTITVMPSGGTAPYTYLWNTDATTQTVTGVGAGTYTVTITDANGCTVNASVTVTEPAFALSTTAQVVSNYNGQDVSCNGSAGGTPDGTVSATPAGGTAPYTYAWSNGATTQTVNNVGAGTYTVTVTDANGCTATASVTVSEPPVLTGNGSVTSDYNGQDVSCNGSTDGTITVAPGGGTAPYTYAWSTGATTQIVTGVGAGTYTVTITDANGCTVNASVTVTEPAFALSATAQVTSNYNGQDISCNGSTDGSVSATAMGGTAPYTYAWSTGAATQSVSGLGIGTYTVTVTDANGCTATTGVTVSQPTVLATTAQVTSNFNGEDLSCNSAAGGTPDGVISATPTGGTAPYTYTWSNGATTQTVNNVGAGTYTVTVRDVNGCMTTASVTVSEPPVLTGNGSVTSDYNGQDVSCNGSTDGTITVAPGGGTAPYTYAWSTGATTQTVNGVGAGTYTVTITDANGCTVNASVTVTEPTFALSTTAQVISNYNGQDVSCNGSASGTPDGVISATPAGGTAPYTYAWSNGATTQTVNNVGAGTYTVTVTDVNGCTTTASVTVSEPPVLTGNGSVTSDYNGQDVSCNGSTDGTITVAPGGGTAPYTYAWSTGATTQTVNGVGAGTYTVIITDANGCTVNASVTVTEPTFALSTTAQVISNYNGQDVSCNGSASGTPDGIISATPTGGTAPYTYAWSNGATTQTVNNVGAGTYNVTVTDVNGCTANASVTVSEPPVLTGNGSVTSDYNGQDVSCNGSTDGTITVAPGGGTAPYTYAWNTGATTQTVNNVGAGTYTVTITDANGCTVNASVTVTEPAFALGATTQVTSDYNGQDVSCNGSTDGSISTTASGGTAPYTYVWSNGATTQAVNNVGAGMYTVTVTDVNGCSVNASVTVTEPVILGSVSSVISNYNGQDVSCNSAGGGTPDGIINVVPTGGTVPYSYAWNNGATTQIASGVGAGTYTATVTDANGCTVASSVTVSEPVVLGSNTSVTSNYNGENIACNGGSNGSAVVTPTGGTAPYTYAWSNGSTASSISGVGAGTYTVTVTDVNGCTDTSSVTVTEPAAIQLTANVTDVLCFGNSTGSINLGVTGGVAPYTYAWSEGSTAEDIAGLPAGSYTVTVTDANGCTANTTRQVTQPAQALGGLLSIDNVSCYGGSDGGIQMTASGGTASYTYSWTNGAATSDISGVTAGTYTVTVTDNNGCTYAASGIVQEPLAPISVSGTVTGVSCFGGNNGSIDLSVTGGTPAYSYQWSHGPLTQDVNGLTVGTYSVTVTDSKGCIDATYTVTVPQPQAGLNVTGVLTHVKCYNESNGAADITVTGGTPPYAYTWSTGAVTEDIAGLPQGNYTLTVTDANGCQHTSYVAQINQPAAPLQISGTVNDISCFGGVNGGVNLSVTGGEPDYVFQWSNGSSSTNISNVPAGQYTVTVNDGRLCHSEATFIVNEPPPMFVNGNVQDNLCYGTPDAFIDLTLTGGVPGYTYQWSTGATSEDVFNLTPGNYTVSVTDANGCNGVAGFTVFEAVPIDLHVDSLHQIFIGNSVELTAEVEGGTGSFSFSWVPDDGTLSCLNCQTTVASPLANTTYIVTVTDGNGCSKFDYAQVLVNQDIFIPNVFTPNGNGTNDTFKPVVRMAKECTFSIFNRWGELIFSSKDPDHGWDGNFHGKPVQVDVYVYHVKVLFYNGVEKVFRGNVTVLR